jgi:hypothetical protein
MSFSSIDSLGSERNDSADLELDEADDDVVDDDVAAFGAGVGAYPETTRLRPLGITVADGPLKVATRCPTAPGMEGSCDLTRAPTARVAVRRTRALATSTPAAAPAAAPYAALATVPATEALFEAFTMRVPLS